MLCVSCSSSWHLQINMLSQQVFGNQTLSLPIAVTGQMALQIELRSLSQRNGFYKLGGRKPRPSYTVLCKCNKEFSILVERKIYKKESPRLSYIRTSTHANKSQCVFPTQIIFTECMKNLKSYFEIHVIFWKRAICCFWRKEYEVSFRTKGDRKGTDSCINTQIWKNIQPADLYNILPEIANTRAWAALALLLFSMGLGPTTRS